MSERGVKKCGSKCADVCYFCLHCFDCIHAYPCHMHNNNNESQCGRERERENLSDFIQLVLCIIALFLFPNIGLAISPRIVGTGYPARNVPCLVGYVLFADVLLGVLVIFMGRFELMLL